MADKPASVRPRNRRGAGAAWPVPRLEAALKVDLKGLWSLTITGNWRLIFRYDEKTNTASDIDLIDYH
jgi:plasmid maintenance system killer protein